jgi:hypothetical protein
MSNEILEALIDRRLWENNPTKYKRLQREGTLKKWIRSQAEAAQRAMESAGPEANDDQVRELASEYLNPLTAEQEAEQEEERNNPQPPPEEMWMQEKMWGGMIEVPPPRKR